MTEGHYYCVYVDDILILTVPGEPADEMQALLSVLEMSQWIRTQVRFRRAWLMRSCDLRPAAPSAPHIRG